MAEGGEGVKWVKGVKGTNFQLKNKIRPEDVTYSTMSKITLYCISESC